MLILTIDYVPNQDIKEIKGFVKGSTIRSKHIGKDITAGLKSIVGGELTGYNEMLVEARQLAIGRMVEDAEKLGANAIIGMRLHSAAITQGAAEVVAYGTAVVI